MTCNTVLGDSLGICGEVQSLHSILCLGKLFSEYIEKHPDSKFLRYESSIEYCLKGTKDQTRGLLCCDDNHCILIFPFEEVTEDVRVNKKLEMSLNGHLAFS